MDIYLTIILVALITILLLVIGKLRNLNYQLEQLTSNNMMDDQATQRSSGWYIYVLLGVAFLSIVFAFCAPKFYTGESMPSNNQNSGVIGDTIGGLMNPFIAFAGVIVTGLAFLMQYEANAQQRKLFLIEQNNNKQQLQDQIDKQDYDRKLQQFESQFYEMIRLHRENVSEMKIEGYDFEEDMTFIKPLKKFKTVTEGRKVFVTMKTELEVILSAYKLDEPLRHETFKLCYNLFFAGIDKFNLSYPNSTVFQNKMEYARQAHQFPTLNEIHTNYKRKKLDKEIDLNFNYKPFSGHASRLGHYFRHLYLIVKSVVYTDVLNTDLERMKYLRILRAQLSNHEQILLFYNWLSQYGQGWESEDHQFFTKYNMIHNLWYNDLVDDPYIKSNVDNLRNKAISIGNNDMFEID